MWLKGYTEGEQECFGVGGWVKISKMTVRMNDKIARIDKLVKMGQSISQACRTVGMKNTSSYHRAVRDRARPTVDESQE